MKDLMLHAGYLVGLFIGFVLAIAIFMVAQWLRSKAFMWGLRFKLWRHDRAMRKMGYRGP